jgi:hypothetical protein
MRTTRGSLVVMSQTPGIGARCREVSRQGLSPVASNEDLIARDDLL